MIMNSRLIYLDEQLESLLTQKFSEWRLMIRDDGSTDETISIMQSYLKRFPKKITIYECSEGNLGPTESFLFLMRKSKSAYVAFCDQDGAPSVMVITGEPGCGKSALMGRFSEEIMLQDCIK